MSTHEYDSCDHEALAAGAGEAHPRELRATGTLRCVRLHASAWMGAHGREGVVMQSGYFDTEVVRMHLFLEELALKDQQSGITEILCARARVRACVCVACPCPAGPRSSREPSTDPLLLRGRARAPQWPAIGMACVVAWM